METAFWKCLYYWAYRSIWKLPTNDWGFSSARFCIFTLSAILSMQSKFLYHGCYFLSIFLLVWFWDRASLYGLGWHGTYCVVQTDIKLGANLFQFIKAWDSMFQLPHSEGDLLMFYKLLYLEWVRNILTYHAHPSTSFWSQGWVSLNSKSTFSL